MKLGDSSNVFRMDSLLVPYKATTAVSVNSSKETDSVIAVVNKRDESSGGARNRDSDDGERAHGDEYDDLSSASSLLSQNMGERV